MSVKASFRTSSLIAASALALNACSSTGGSDGLLDKVAGTAGSIAEGASDAAGAVVDGVSDAASGVVGAVTDTAAAALDVAGAGSVEPIMKVTKTSHNCIVTHTKGRTVISSAGAVQFQAPECDAGAVQAASSDVAASTQAAAASNGEPELIEVTTHFDFDSADLTAADRAKLDELAESLGPVTARTIEISAFTDPAGTDAHNDKLSQARAQMIAEYLAMKGLDAENWSLLARGEDTSNVRPADARRAEVSIQL